MHERFKTSNSFPLNESIMKNRACMRGFQRWAGPSAYLSVL